MPPKRRRKPHWSRRLRRYLVEHRFNAAEGLLGAVGLIGSIWFLWPEVDARQADHRTLWRQTLASPESEDLAPARAIATSGPSGAISSKLGLSGGFILASLPSREARLEQVAATMPEIGPPDPAVVPTMPSLRILEALQHELVAKEDTPDVAPAPEGDAAPEIARLAPPAPPQASQEEPEVERERRVANFVIDRGPLRLKRDAPNWLRLAAAPPVFDDRPQVAVVIDDLGMNRRNTAALNELPAPLTLAFLPYAGELRAQTRAARAAGHELMLHMPMEPQGQDWPGPNALLISLSQDEFEGRMRANFESFEDFVGLNNHMGSRLTADPQSMALIMAELKKRDLLFLDSMTTAGSVGVLEARRQGVPFAQRDIFLDNQLDLRHVLHQLARTEEVARRRGIAVAIGHPHDVTVEALKRWLPDLAQRGIRLVPISTVVARETCRRDPGWHAGCERLQTPGPTLVSRVPGPPT